jgi:hypothetical protein
MRNSAAIPITKTLHFAMKIRGAVVLCSSMLIWGAVTQAPDEGYSREQLQPLTKFRCAILALHICEIAKFFHVR